MNSLTHRNLMTVFPDRRLVTPRMVLAWAREAEADGKIEGCFESNVGEAMRQLEDAGLVKFRR